MILLERVRKARKARDKAEETFLEALLAARPVHSLSEIADAAGLTREAVHYRTSGANERRRARKQEQGGD